MIHHILSHCWSITCFERFDFDMIEYRFWTARSSLIVAISMMSNEATQLNCVGDFIINCGFSVFNI